MNPPSWNSGNAAKVREELLRRVAEPDTVDGPLVRSDPRRSVAMQWPAILVTAVVLVAVVALSLVAVRLSGDRELPATTGGSSPAVLQDSSPPEQTLPPGKVLGRFTSEDGPNQDHVLRPNGLALATQFICTGEGKYSVFTSGGTGESGDGGCSGGGVGAGGGGVNGTSHVKIRTDPDMTWTYTIVGFTPPKHITPRPIATPTTTGGEPVPYCTGDDLSARFDRISAAAASAIGYEPSGEITFTNTTKRTCALAGYPEVRFLDDGKPLGHNTMNQIDPRRSVVNGLRAVILAPGGSAYSQVNWYKPGDNKQEGPCVARAVTSVDVDLHYDLAASGQTGRFTVPIGRATACLNGAHGALGKYGQIMSTVFVAYSLNQER
ncbi:hypothetical protein GCM10025783_05670 [Amnibacterium soli]|uniref:DUF4232 domain-containing protein n=1 Tax=Amnibacterium soli TaxID=1282736 RepID=A0ABP8YTB0_9MICO